MAMTFSEMTKKSRGEKRETEVVGSWLWFSDVAESDVFMSYLSEAIQMKWQMWIWSSTKMREPDTWFQFFVVRVIAKWKRKYKETWAEYKTENASIHLRDE